MGKILKGLFIILILAVVAIVVMVFIPRQVDVAYTEADLQSYLAKGGVTQNENSASFEDIILGRYESIGVVVVDDFITSAEATAILNETAKENGLMSDVRVKFIGPDKVAASAKITADMSPVYEIFPMVKPYESLINTVVGKTLYIEMDLRKAEGNSFEAMLTSASVGYLPIPLGQANDAGTELGTYTNNVISNLNGFNMEAFNVDETGLHFKGTIPQEVQSRLD